MGWFEVCHTLQFLNFVKVQSTSASAAGCRLQRLGAVALIVAAVIMLCASTPAFHLWKTSDKNVSVNRGLCSSYCIAPSVPDISDEYGL